MHAPQAVIGAYLNAKRAREWPRLQRGTNRAEYMYSRLDIRYYNHLMHKLESLSRGVACMPDRRATWTQVGHHPATQQQHEASMQQQIL